MGSKMLEKVEHGGVNQKFRDSSCDGIIDFSVNINPYPPDFAWRPNLPAILHYPDDRYQELKEALAGRIKRDADEITVGNGSVEVMRTFCHVMTPPGTHVAIEDHTFGEYAHSVQIAGGTCLGVDSRADLRFLCNPNNPTGELHMRDNVMALVESAEDSKTMLCVDEAFIELSDPAQSVADCSSPALFVFRSLTKSFAVPGLRLGFGIGNPEVVSALEAVRPPWTVNCFAESYALAALEHYEDLEESRRQIATERRWLCQRFDELGIGYHPPSANYILLETGIPASDFTSMMLSNGIYVRDCTSFGLPNSVRVAVRTREENSRLVEALSACLC